MDQAGRDQAPSLGARRVRDHRARRRAAGLVEVKAWVRAEDMGRAWAALRPLTDEAARGLARHARRGGTNRIVVTLRFARTPPGAFREGVLRRGWGLSWDRVLGCWHGAVEGEAAAAELRRVVATHGGAVERAPGRADGP